MNSSRLDQIKIQFEKLMALMPSIIPCDYERTRIENKLRRHFNTALSEYLCSDDFAAALDQTYCQFQKHHTSTSTKYFTLLAILDEHMKTHSIKSLLPNPSAEIVSIPTAMEIEEPAVITSVPSPDPIAIAVQETIDYLLDQCSQVVIAMSSPVKRERQIAKLERRLVRLSKMIRRLEETEMSLDDMAHGDLYVVESNLKEQAFEIYTKLSKLKNQSLLTERILHRPIVLPALDFGHSLIQDELQRMVDQSNFFPSFHDVLNTVERVNDQHQLNISETMQRTMAEKAFKIIGKEMKQRRIADFEDVMSSRLPENFNVDDNDPALSNPEMETALNTHQREALQKTEEILEEFARRAPDPDENQEEQEETIAPSATTAIEAVEQMNSSDPEIVIGEVISESPTPSTTPEAPVKKERTSIENPRRPTPNDIIYMLYQQRLTNGNRPSNQSSDVRVKRPRLQEPEVIVLD